MNTAKALHHEDYNKPQLRLLRFDQGTETNVSNNPQPVRKVTVVVSASSGGIDPEMGDLFSVEYMDGTKREAFVRQGDKGHLMWEEAAFLNKGRVNNHFYAIVPYISDAPDDIVPSTLIPKMKEAIQAHNKVARTALLASYNQRPAP